MEALSVFPLVHPLALLLTFSIVMHLLYCEPCLKNAAELASLNLKPKGLAVVQVHLPAAPHSQVFDLYDADFVLSLLSGLVVGVSRS